MYLFRTESTSNHDQRRAQNHNGGFWAYSKSVLASSISLLLKCVKLCGLVAVAGVLVAFNIAAAVFTKAFLISKKLFMLMGINLVIPSAIKAAATGLLSPLVAIILPGVFATAAVSKKEEAESENAVIAAVYTVFGENLSERIVPTAGAAVALTTAVRYVPAFAAMATGAPTLAGVAATSLVAAGGAKLAEVVVAASSNALNSPKV